MQRLFFILILLLLASPCWATAPSFDVYFIAPQSATRMSPCPVFAYIEMGRRCWPIAGGATGEPGITWTNSSGNEYVMDVSIISLSTSGTGTPRNVRVKTGETFNWGSIGGDDQYLTEGTVGSLAAGQFAVSGGNLYVRLADDTSPASKGAGGSGGYLQLEFDVADFGASDTSNLGGSGWTSTTGSEYSYDTALFDLDPACTGIFHVSEGAGLSNAELTRGTAGSLAAGEFDIVGDKVHIRLSDSSNPNSAGASDITIYAEYTGDQCECLPRFYGTGVDAMPDWARYTTDPRPGLNSRQIDVTGNDTTNKNRPHGFNWGILAFEGSVTAEWTVTNPNGDSTTETVGPITIAANSRTQYTVGSDMADDYSTLAEAFAALGDSGSVPTTDIELIVDDGHSEDIDTDGWFNKLLDNWYVHRADTGGAQPEIHYIGDMKLEGANGGQVFDPSGAEQTVVRGFKYEDDVDAAEGTTADNSNLAVTLYKMGQLGAAIELDAYSDDLNASVDSGYIPPDSDPYPWEGGNGRGCLVMNSFVTRTYNCTCISAGGWHGGEQLVFIGVDGGPSNGENVFRFSTNEHYIAFGWCTATEDALAGNSERYAPKTNYRFAGCHFTTRYGTRSLYSGSFTGRTNDDRGTGSNVQRIEAEYYIGDTDAITAKESSYDLTVTDCVLDGNHGTGFYSAARDGPSGRFVIHHIQHNTSYNVRSYNYGNGTGDDDYAETWFVNNLLSLSTVDWQSTAGRVTERRCRLYGNVFDDETPGTLFIQFYIDATTSSTATTVANLNAKEFASNNTLDADLSLDADYISNGPVTVTTMPGSYSDYYGTDRGTTSWAGAVGSEPASESQGVFQTFIPGVLLQTP